MTIECPPPRVLWAKLLKMCSFADLALLRSQTLNRISRIHQHISLATDNECKAFLAAIQRETRRRSS